MILTPKDISAFVYCPYFKYTNKINGKFEIKFTLFEQCVINSIKLTEKHCLLHNSDISTRKILTRWDNIWWPSVSNNNINFKTAEEKSIKASMIFNDYCKYDISGYLYPTAGIDIESEINIGRSIIKTNADIIKVNLNLSQKNINLIGFGNTIKSTKEIILDPAIRTLLYSFSETGAKTLVYTYIYIKEDKEKILVTSSVLRQDDIEEIKNTLTYIEKGISNKVRYMNLHNCKECKQCQNLKL